MRRHRPISACLAMLFGLASCSADRVDPNGDRDVVPPRVDAVQRDAQDSEVPADEGTPEDVSARDAATPDDGVARCVPDNDGTILQSEVPYALGASVLFAVNDDGTTVDGVNTAGVMEASGRVWDYAAPRAEDRRILDQVSDPAGRWWSSRYPTATFVLPLDRAQELLGVYRVSEGALQLLATVSREANRTELAMDPPVDVIRYPLVEGAQWEQSVTARGLLNFTGHTNVTRYTFRVDARGTVSTPARRFPVLRLATDVDQTIPFTVFRRRQRTFVFLSECWGMVARVASVDNETAMEFTRASEYRRLGL